ncbi:hypothetical protein [Cupriavidus cauae]|uniref:Uncharacterized protein n=1 Tax=Cupriavidus cauae TaxID=2608999 RepID=A0A5M8B2G1_9BURK|nr:hypothetical protein [Cupriavidus cauae]KAA6129282.1 hypothetical protein F1599_05950 [Cupriavidus cauae]
MAASFFDTCQTGKNQRLAFTQRVDIWRVGFDDGRSRDPPGDRFCDRKDGYAVHYLSRASDERSGVGRGVFAILEAAGTVHLTWKADRKKSELKEYIRQCANGHERFVHGDDEYKERIAWLFDRQRELEALLRNWPVDDENKPLPEIAHESDPTQPPRKLADTEAGLQDVVEQLKERALELVKDLKDYIQYEQAANELADATDNIHALGLATARDVVIQLGGTACSVAATLGKAGVPGVNLAAAGVAGGAFSVAMGTMHVAAGALAWYQATRRLEDIQAARIRGSDWQDPHARQRRVSDIASALPQERPRNAASAKASVPVIAQQHEPAQEVEHAESARLADIQRANDMIEVMMHHREKAFGAIEAAERLKIWWAKFRMAYGGVSIGIGTGLIVAAAVFGLVPRSASWWVPWRC